jgi:hypothetical protein
MERRKAGGGAEDVAMASGGEVQLGQMAGDMAEREEASARPVSGGASDGAARGPGQSSVEAARQRTWPGSGGGARQRKNRGRERGRRRRTQMQFQKNAGTLL